MFKTTQKNDKLLKKKAKCIKFDSKDGMLRRSTRGPVEQRA